MNLIERLEMIKDIDPYNRQLLNDCYERIMQLEDQIARLKNALETEYDLANTEQKL